MLWSAFVPTDLSGRYPGSGPTPRPRDRGPSAGQIIMLLFIASLSVGIGAIMAFYLLLRAKADVWPPPGTPPLPAGLWITSALIVTSSGTMHLAVQSARRGRPSATFAAVLCTLALAVAFLAGQFAIWGLAVAARMPPGLNGFSICFYLLTGVHALHIIGGLPALIVVAMNTRRGRYTPAHHAGLSYAAMYWHFVDVAWLAMFGMMLATV